MSFTIAHTIAEAVDALAGGARPIAGGSDLVVGARHGKAPLPSSLVAVDRIEEMGTIDDIDGGLRIGAGVTHARLLADPLVLDRATGLADAASLIGSPATRNVGTIGGNVMNASPAMDTGAPLLVLGAQVELASTRGVRTVDIAELWTGPGSTTATADELCTAIVLPPTAGAAHGSAYVRLEYRRAMEIAVVGAAASVLFDGDQVVGVRVALTAVAPTIVEVTGLDPHGDDLLDQVAAEASAQARPISDLRASDDYRRHTVGVMARRATAAALARAQGEHIAVPVNHAVGIGA